MEKRYIFDNEAENKVWKS